MPDIKDSVGEGCANLTHDVALVQAMLRVVKNANGAPYFNAAYDGVYSSQTKTAITNFQIDNKLVNIPNAPNAPPGPNVPNGPKAPNLQQAPKAPAGLDAIAVIKKGSATLKKLVASLPAEYAKMRIIERTKTVYLEGDQAAATASQNTIGSQPDLEVTFRGAVLRLVELMFNTHKLVLSLAPKGTRRTFQEQANLDPRTTKAGPGESNHNFGRAVDIGFNNIKWLAGDGTIVKDDWWFNKLARQSQAKADGFWEERDRIADLASPILFRIGKWDRPHLQSFNDAKVSMGRSLVALLNAVGKTKWAPGGGRPNRYKSDLGLGGKTYDVGTARQIWAEKATVTKAMLAEAKSAFLSAKLKKTVVVKAEEIKEADLAAVRTSLKADFQAADAKWKYWTPVA